jgi:hypothetical protein
MTTAESRDADPGSAGDSVFLPSVRDPETLRIVTIIDALGA